MEYVPFEKIRFYKECAPLVEGLGYKLVDLKIIPAKNVTKISVVIAGESDKNIGVEDCAKVHRILLPRLEALLGTEETSMELTSPGISHKLQNAAEFFIFKGFSVKIFDKNITDWVFGTIIESDEKSVTIKSNDEKLLIIKYEDIAKAKLSGD